MLRHKEKPCNFWTKSTQKKFHMVLQFVNFLPGLLRIECSHQIAVVRNMVGAQGT